MAANFDLLATLADQQWHSGEALGLQFALSRTAIWKHVSNLRAQGLTIDADRGKGYRLLDPVQWYDESTIRKALCRSIGDRITIAIAPTLESTNKACLQLIGQQDHSPGLHGYLQLAEQQTGGRGRRGRSWVSPPGCNIYASLIWRFEGGANSLAGLSLVVGIALVRALESSGYEGLQLKWPNDIHWQGRKLAGILLEVSGDVAGACDVVIGFGINVAMPVASREAIDQPWVDLVEISPAAKPVKSLLIAAILDALVVALNQFEREGFAAFSDEWSSRDACLGKRVALQLGASGGKGNSAAIEGNYRGVNVDGSISIETPAGLQQFSGGEISLRQSDSRAQ